MSGKKSARKGEFKIPQDPDVPQWFFDKDLTLPLKREVENALVVYAVTNEIEYGSPEFKAITFKTLISTLRKLYVRWSKVKSMMISTYTQPTIHKLSVYTTDCKK